jgi:Mrp family chromosome partitioning ATPase
VSQVFKALQQAGFQLEEAGRPVVSPLPLNKGRSTATTTAQFAPEVLKLFFALEALKSADRPFVLQFVSAIPGEGTSTVASSFAGVASLERGKPVLLVDCNPSPAAEQDSPTDGLIEAHRNGGSLAPSLSGTHRPGDREAHSPLRARMGASRNPLLDVDSEELQRILTRAREEFAITVLDCAPVTRDPQSAALSRFCDGTVLVVQAEAARRQVIQAARSEIERHGGHIVGVVFNRRRYYIPDWVYRRL